MGEACDDGVNDGLYGGCNPDCTLAPYCGDGDVQEAEGCDDGDAVEGNGCNGDCVVSGTRLWTHVFVTQEDDHVDSPYFRGDSSPVVRAWNLDVNDARTLGREDGEILGSFELPPNTRGVMPWGEDDSFLVAESTGSVTSIGDIALSRFSTDGVEQWRREFESESAYMRMAVRPGEAVLLSSFAIPSVLSTEGDRRVRVLDAGGNEVWSVTASAILTRDAYDTAAFLSDGTALLSNDVSGVGNPADILDAFNSGGGLLWSLVFETEFPELLTAVGDSRWVARQGNGLEVRGPTGDLEHEASFEGLFADFAAYAPNGDVVVAGTGNPGDPSSVARLSPELDLLWQAAPTEDDLPFFEVTGVAVGPGNEVLVTADAYVVEAQEVDGWAILFAP